MVAQPALLDGVHVEEVVVDRGVRRDGETAAVVPPVADGDLHEVGELERGAVVELEAGGERPVGPVRRQGGRRVGEAAEPLLERRGESLGDGDGETDRGDVEVGAPVDAPEVDVDDVAVDQRVDRRRQVVGDPERAGEVVGGPEGQHAERGAGVGDHGGRAADRAVAPTDHEQVGLGLDGDRQRLEELEPAVHGVHRHVVRHTADGCLHERERTRPAAGCGVDDDCDPTGARLGGPVLLHAPTLGRERERTMRTTCARAVAPRRSEDNGPPADDDARMGLFSRRRQPAPPAGWLPPERPHCSCARHLDDELLRTIDPAYAALRRGRSGLEPAPVTVTDLLESGALAADATGTRRTRACRRIRRDCSRGRSGRR